ncbi:MAG: hypothetical protein M3256_11630 [Actinomycetota bacterium]|nr:hypothetical protein [Actinomycetota bacterium]
MLTESAKARLSILTPVCTVLWGAARMLQGDGTSIGNVPMEAFKSGSTMVEVLFQVRNDSPHPALVTAKLSPCTSVGRTAIGSIAPR